MDFEYKRKILGKISKLFNSMTEIINLNNSKYKEVFENYDNFLPYHISSDLSFYTRINGIDHRVQSNLKEIFSDENLFYKLMCHQGIIFEDDEGIVIIFKNLGVYSPYVIKINLDDIRRKKNDEFYRSIIIGKCKYKKLGYVTLGLGALVTGSFLLYKYNF
jgi:hypothetical protein